MSEELTYRSYNDFSKQAIYNNSGDLTSHTDGWRDDYLGQDATSTPINADNLNTMLQMLIDIRDVIGKTSDFAVEINGEDIDTPNIESNKSVATYIKAVADAIIGEATDDSEKLTLNSIKNYIENLDLIDCGTAPGLIDNGGTN